MRHIPGLNFISKLNKYILAVFSRRRMSRLKFLRALCLQTLLSDLKLMGVFTNTIILKFEGNRRAKFKIQVEEATIGLITVFDAILTGSRQTGLK